jgi:4-hydroxythreonine-4-phosphate dehydrogenase
LSPAAPVIALTPGEPAGIGPDIVVTLAAGMLPAAVVAVADRGLLAERAAALGLELELPAAGRAGGGDGHEPGVLPVHHVPLGRPVRCGCPDPANAAYVLETIRAATAGCLAGRWDGLTTGPIQKSVIADTGTPFSGHTEFLAELTGAELPVMMLAAGDFRVALATTHLPLAAVSAAIDGLLLDRVIAILDRDLRTRFGLPRPRILVCGLNPHAGEGGHLGHEDGEIIAPAIARARAGGLAVSGPYPADTVFTPRHLEQADVVLAMFHDQGLPVLKYAGFGRAVNVTLGLPIVRTSVDHGTALDLAGTGRADAGSLHEAIALAARMAAGARA